MGFPEQAIRRLRSALREKDRRIGRHEKTIGSLRRLQDMEDGPWDVTKERCKHETGVPLLHAGEAVSDILSDGGKLATVTSFGPRQVRPCLQKVRLRVRKAQRCPAVPRGRRPRPGQPPPAGQKVGPAACTGAQAARSHAGPACRGLWHRPVHGVWPLQTLSSFLFHVQYAGVPGAGKIPEGHGGPRPPPSGRNIKQKARAPLPKKRKV